MKKQAEDWLKYAYKDLQSARILISDELLLSTAAFHCQQCIEKSLKALLELNDKRIPKIHDLRKLLNNVEENNFKFEIDHEILDQINQVYIDTRYPADYGILPEGAPSLEKVNSFILTAEKVFKTTKQIINIK